jgi:FkbM family methyltransferase
MNPGMKPKELLYLLGIRKPEPRVYGHEVVSFDLPRDGRVEYARWLHPLVQREPVRQAEVDGLRTFLSPGDVVIDIGAHGGDTTVPLGLAVGPTGAVLACEPNRYVFPVLEANARLNADKTRIIPYCYAATPEDGKMTFEYSDPGFCNGGRHEGISRWRHGHVFDLEVEGVNLDRFLSARHPDLLARLRYVKVDAEGFDRAILESLRGLITRLRPRLRSEFFKRLSREQRVAQLRTITSMGYRVTRVDGDLGAEGEPVTEGNVMAWKHFDVFATPI